MAWVGFALIGVAVVLLLGVVGYLLNQKSSMRRHWEAQVDRIEKESKRDSIEDLNTAQDTYDKWVRTAREETAVLRRDLRTAKTGWQHQLERRTEAEAALVSAVKDRIAKIEQLKQDFKVKENNWIFTRKAHLKERTALETKLKELEAEMEKQSVGRVVLFLKGGGKIVAFCCFSDGDNYRVVPIAGGEVVLKKDLVEKIEIVRTKK